MNALWIGLLAGATGIAALVIAFLADRRSRTAIHRVDKIEHAPRAEGAVLETRNGHRIGFDDLKGRLTLLVNVPAQGAYPSRLARLESVRHLFGADVLDIVAVPIGNESRAVDETTRRAGSVPVLAAVDEHPLADAVAGTFPDLDEPYTKLLVDSDGRIVARFAAETDPRGIELSRAVQAFEA